MKRLSNRITDLERKVRQSGHVLVILIRFVRADEGRPHADQGALVGLRTSGEPSHQWDRVAGESEEAFTGRVCGEGGEAEVLCMSEGRQVIELREIRRYADTRGRAGKAIEGLERKP